jgi:signal transduction histidine kinase
VKPRKKARLSLQSERLRAPFALAMLAGMGILLGVFHDRFKKTNRALTAALSEGRRANEQLRRANDEVSRLHEKTQDLERLRAEWSALIAHDLRQPVAVVTLASALIRKVHARGMDDVEARQLDRIDCAARRLATMIDELLDATRLEAHRMAVRPSMIDVAAIAREVCERVANVTAGHPVSVCEDGICWKAWADPTRIEQVIANLLSNASKYGASGSEIRVDVQGREEEVEVSVTNSGRGIAPEELPRLFQRFMRSHASLATGTPGIGLGLYICKGLIEAHGGRIWVESTPGERTSFHFTLPRTPGKASEGGRGLGPFA